MFILANQNMEVRLNPFMEPVTINLLGSFEKKLGKIKKKTPDTPPKTKQKESPPRPTPPKKKK